MKKIITSSVIVLTLLVAVAWGTRSLFTDTETSTGNTFTTGTIDIAVDGQNPWEATDQISLADMKPSQTGYYEFVVHNVGTNPANLWKSIVFSECENDPEGIPQSEPECLAESGNYDDDVCTGNTPKCNFSSTIRYDLRVELYTADPDANPELEPVWWETIYADEPETPVDQVHTIVDLPEDMYLGMIPADWYMKVIQSYHMDSEAGNEYQGDSMTFDVTLNAEQLTNSVDLVRKFEANGELARHIWDGYATFSYKVKDAELNWDLDTTDVANGHYTLMVWDDSDHSYAWDWNTRSDAVVLGHITVYGDGTHSGTYNPDHNIVNAKVWLVPGTYGADVGDSMGDFTWEAATTYFETGLITFYDSLN